MKTIIEEAVDNMDRMTELLHKQIETYRELQRALLLADLLGVPPKDIKGPLRYSVRKGDSVLKPWVGAVLSVRVGDGPYEDFLLTDVDRRLWPEDMQQAWGRWQKQQEKKKR